MFSDVHAAGKHDLTLFRRLRPAELCEALAAQSAEMYRIARLPTGAPDRSAGLFLRKTVFQKYLDKILERVYDIL